MTVPVRVADLAAYLANSGWQPEPQEWNGATIWARDDAEVLVPPSDQLGDTAARVRDALRCLEAVEDRPAAAIVREIAFPLLDAASYRTVADDRPAGFLPLSTGVRAMSGVRDLFGAAARATVEGPHPRFLGAPPEPVVELLEQVQIGATRTDRFALTLLVPVTAPAEARDDVPTGRQVLLRMHDATAAAERAVRADDLTAFDETVAAGVSAEFCAALGELAGSQQPFELDFRWAVGLPAGTPDRRIGFPPRTGTLLKAASQRLIDLDAPAATVAGRVQDLHDDPDGGRRWRVRVSGQLRRAGRRTVRRAIWVQLPHQNSYDVALAAHRDGVHVRVDGALAGAGRQVELIARPDGLQLDPRNDDA